MVTKKSKEPTRKATNKAASKKSVRSTKNKGAAKKSKSKSSPGIISRVKKAAGKILAGAASGAAKGAVVGAVEAGSEVAGNGQDVGGLRNEESSSRKARQAI
jgi:hypothetical protein